MTRAVAAPQNYAPGAVPYAHGTGAPTRVSAATTSAVPADWGAPYEPSPDVLPTSFCTGTKSDGTPCRARHTSDSSYCVGHKRSLTAASA